MSSRRFLITIGSVCWIVALLPLIAAAAEPRRPLLTPDQIYKQVVPATAFVFVGTGHGTGWLLDRDEQLVITNAHVVGKRPFVRVRFPTLTPQGLVTDYPHYLPPAAADPMTAFPDKVLAVDAERDLAVIRLATPPPALPIPLTVTTPRPLDTVYVVGHPETNLWQRNQGKILHALGGDISVICPRFNNHGVSGAPVVNELGELVGVMKARNRASPQHCLCTDALTVRLFLQENGFKKFAPSREQLAERLEQLGQQALASGDTPQAIEHYAQAIRLQPERADLHRLRGQAHLRLGDNQKAIADFSEAIRRSAGKDADALQQRGLLYLGQREYTLAIADLRVAIRLGHRDEMVYRYLALAHNERGVAHSFQDDDDAAVADYSAAIAADAAFTRAYRNRGAVYLRRGEYAQAIADFSEAIRLDPGYVRAYRERAEAYAQLGQREAANRDRAKVEQLIKAQP